MRPNRRAFIKAAGSAAALALAGCRDPSPSREGSISGGQPVSTDPFAGGVLLGALPFIGEANPRMETQFGRGLDGRLFTDHANLVPDKLNVSVDRFYIRTLPPASLDTNGPWSIRVRGLVARETDLALQPFDPLVQPMGTFLMECAGNGRGEHFGMMSSCEWGGIPLGRVLEQTAPTSHATRLLINGFDDHAEGSERSTRGASWVFTPDQLQRAFFATQMNGTPLTREHGFPVRLVVPGWYGCTAIKWVDELRWVNDDEPATSQMIEFASRTHQEGTPPLARDYRPAEQAFSAMPVRVEKWAVGGRKIYRVVGLLWGGSRPTNDLEIQLGRDQPFARVDDCPVPASTDTWTLWSHKWNPTHAGDYTIALRVNDPGQHSVRLDIGHYARTVRITEV